MKPLKSERTEREREREKRGRSERVTEKKNESPNQPTTPISPVLNGKPPALRPFYFVRWLSQ